MSSERSSEQRRREGHAAAKRAYEEGNGLVALHLTVECVVQLEERIQELEGALRDATSFMKLVLTLKTLTQGDEALSNSFKWLASLEAALSPSEAPEKEEGEDDM